MSGFNLNVAAAFLSLVCAILNTVTSWGADRAPVPDEEAEQKALSLLREMFFSEYKSARTAAEKEALARKIFKQAPNCPRGSADKYVVLHVTSDIASEAGAVGLAFDAMNGLGREFQVDSLAMKMRLLRKEADANRPSKQSAEAGKLALSTVDAVLGARDYLNARELAQIAERLAKKSRDRDLMQRADARLADVEQIARAFEQAQEMLPILDKEPDHPEANLAVGRFRCLVEGNWTDGLSMLALGSQADCQLTAIQELRGVENVAELIALADAWNGLANNEVEPFAAAMRRHAAVLYKQALPHASGLIRKKVELRLAELPRIKHKVPGVRFVKPDATTGEPAKVALAPKPAPATTADVPTPPTTPDKSPPATSPVSSPPTPAVKEPQPEPIRAPEPTPPAVDRTPDPSSKFARVSMPGVTAKALKEGVCFYKNYSLTNIPDFVAQGFVVLKGGNVRANTTRFSVQTDGLVYLLLSGRPGGGGSGGPWQRHITKPAQLVAAGWQPAGKINFRDSPPSVIYSRTCRQGESFELSWEKYVPPAVIAPADLVE